MANEFQHKDPGSALTQAEYITTDGTGHIFDSQATGDIMYADSATVLKNLARGSTSQLLQIASCKPAWTSTPSIGSTSWANANHAHAASNSGGTLTTVGALDAGSITSGFGTIDTGASTITTTGLISGGSLDIDNVLINGTTIGHTCDTDLLTLGNATLLAKGTVTVGVCGTGHDVKLFGCAAGAYVEWDESANLFEVRGATAAGPGHLKLTTGELTVVACDVLGQIEFQAPLEADCSADARLVAAKIAAVAQGTFGDAVNATDLIFYTGHSEAATEKFRFTSQGEIGIGGANYGNDGQVLTSGGAGAAAAWEAAPSGKFKQFVQATNVRNHTATTTVPDDDTIPQNDEGIALLDSACACDKTTATLTPGASDNDLIIMAHATWSHSATGMVAMSLFKDDGAAAVATVVMRNDSADTLYSSTLIHRRTAGDTNEQDYTLRIGSNAAGTMRWNGGGGGRLYGGALESGIKIFEVDL